MSYQHASVEIDGDELRRMRKEAGLTATQLARRIGISLTYLSKIERGERRTVPPARYITICDALGVTDRATLHAPQAAAA